MAEIKTSELFQDCFMDGGTPSIDCGFCGRTHFTHEDENYEALCAKAEAAPDKYVHSDNDSIGFGYLDGKRFVWMCPCDAGARYESFIWNHRERIADYLRKRAAKQLEDAKRAVEAVK